jgi:hypothetical protein
VGLPEKQLLRDALVVLHDSLVFEMDVVLESVGLGGSSEEEIGSGDAEEQVGCPGSEDGREGVDVAHGLEEAINDPIGDAEPDGGGDSCEGATFSHG